MNRIIYNTVTGKIESCRNMSDHILALQLQQGANLASIDGYVQNTQEYRVNLETLAVESQSDPLKQFDIQEYMRQRRNNLLKACDWTQGVDSPLSDSKKTEWQTYRQALRDVPANNTGATDRDSITWPSEPT